ncbi:alpha/beta hydrolase [Lactiplantibacillus mudanjiangensis]|uniref:Peptidase M13 [Lactobacillus pentosus] n=1 Tax=Lactiplantibacillus mudanjiangensis TaxID=1296538 RepID=A0A660DUH1_9LACO|nr:alpha/beta fold hydrolase [Lactiplantibacillus mudanjiangensis]VDG21010.1 peptidase M13 [Lactobacillus pentosus] [Lactiplantibacillus mudanjiangensis]VDG22793.1 peptidase M13 [Lactobacillus pentosus] [Lactiplantibacillus mudanjiangensis]VDG26637.1 peptidase M13 [Lactobacillus pentosus] [Lactiplantibacillus mudanjiangensis]VDG31869.1 peptidase M13 [Lactobacillus pentosus] [Lactiplantibacillus mudanjiangensis]
MSIHQNNFYSNVLKRPTNVTVILPEPMTASGSVATDYVSGSRLLPTIWLLHGLGGDATSWVRRTSIELLATQYRVAVVMPETDRGFYTDMVAGPKYWTYLTTELMARMRFIFPLASERAQNFVMGNSMGGYGALRWALNFPEKFAAVAALSPVTDLAKFQQEQAALMPDFELAFSPEQLATGPANLPYLLAHYQAPTPALRVLMTAGDADILRDMDEQFRPQLAVKLGSDFTWQQQAGRHDWTLWNQQLPAAMHWLIKGGWRIV